MLLEFLGSAETQCGIAETCVIIPGTDLGKIDCKFKDPNAEKAMGIFAGNAPVSLTVTLSAQRNVRHAFSNLG